MTTTPALNDDLVRPIVGIENRTPQEVFDIMADRFRAYDRAIAAEIVTLRAAMEPFVAAFDVRRDAYSRRHKDRELGYANFDKMPDAWPMEKIEFRMSHFRRARTALKGA